MKKFIFVFFIFNCIDYNEIEWVTNEELNLKNISLIFIHDNIKLMIKEFKG